MPSFFTCDMSHIIFGDGYLLMYDKNKSQKDERKRPSSNDDYHVNISSPCNMDIAGHQMVSSDIICDVNIWLLNLSPDITMKI